MAKQRLKLKKKTAGIFVRLHPEFKKRAQVYGIENDMSLTEMVIDGIELLMNSKDT